MIKRVLIGFAIASAIILALLWLFTGGFGKIMDTGRSLTDILTLRSFSASGLSLPWQPDAAVRGPDISVLFDETGNATTQELAEAEAEYEELLKKIEETKTFGDPSPYREQVHIHQGNATANTPNTEYLTLEASWKNTAPISMRGWSVQSALTGLRGYVPRATHPFLMGAINTQNDLSLDPGDSVYLTSGTSPVGTSFRTNSCTGHLIELQTFAPALERSCPSPRDSFALTPENLQTYGEACYDFIQTLPSCTLPRTVPANLSSACHAYLVNNFSYNGCVQNHRHESNFAGNEWRLYMSARGELWRNTHDIIRLLDEKGRTVDYISY